MWIFHLSLWLLPVAAAAQGIVHVQLSTPNPDPNFPWDAQGLRLLSGGEPRTYNMDMNGDGITEFTFSSANFSLGGFSIIGSGQNAVIAIGAVPPDLGGYVVPLQAGVEVRAAWPGPGEWVAPVNTGGTTVGLGFTACSTIGCLGLFTGLESGYAGLQFQLDGQTHYGWARVGAPLAGFNGGWIYEYAYQTQPDTPILTGAVPEPTSLWLLAAAGLAGAVIRVWRVRTRR